jgi:predicted transcriptional regulator
VVRLRMSGASELQISDMVGMSEAMVVHYCRLYNKSERALAAVHYLDGTTRERALANASKTKA